MPKYRVRDGQQLPHNGEVLDAGATWGFKLGRGSATIAAEYRDRAGTNRAGFDTGDQLQAGFIQMAVVGPATFIARINIYEKKSLLTNSSSFWTRWTLTSLGYSTSLRRNCGGLINSSVASWAFQIQMRLMRKST